MSPIALRIRLASIVGVAFVVFTLVGCGSKPGLNRFAIHGQVSVGGKLVTSGSILFLPTDANTGPAASTSIDHGKYRFTSANGPVSGSHEVIVNVAPSSNSPTSSRAIKEGAAAVQELDQASDFALLPAQRTTKVTITPTGSLQQDFQLP